MLITLYTEALAGRMKAVSHREAATIEDVEARYAAEAGSEKIDDIERCIADGAKRLNGLCLRFLVDSFSCTTDNLHVFPISYAYEFSFSERRAIGKATPLQEAMTTFVLEHALSEFYATVNQGELSNKHRLLEKETGENIYELIYTKQPPRV